MKPSQAVLEYLKQYRLGDEWIDSVPLEIRSAFFDNPYIDSKENQLSALLDVVLPEGARYDLELYIEGKYSLVCTNNGVKINICDDDEGLVKMLIDFYNIDRVIRFGNLNNHHLLQKETIMNNNYQATLTKLVYELEILKKKEPTEATAALKSLVKELKSFRKELKNLLDTDETSSGKD